MVFDLVMLYESIKELHVEKAVNDVLFSYLQMKYMQKL